MEPELSDATPDLVVSFLISKDATSHTVVHQPTCPGVGTRTWAPQCPALGCAKRAAATTNQTRYGQLRGACNRAGLSDVWNPFSRTGNPCAAPEVTTYVDRMHEEQLASGTLRSKATLFDGSVFAHIMGAVRQQYSYHVGKANYVKAAMMAQDLLHYAIMWQTGLRNEDTINLLAQNIVPFAEPGRNGWHLHVGVTKTGRRVSQARILTMVDDGSENSPMVAYATLVTALQPLGLVLGPGPLFFRLGKQSKAGPAWQYDYCYRRLAALAAKTTIPAGITPHSFHGSRGAADRAKGVPAETTCEELDWTLGTYGAYLDGQPVRSMTELTVDSIQG